MEVFCHLELSLGRYPEKKNELCLGGYICQIANKFVQIEAATLVSTGTTFRRRLRMEIMDAY